MENFQEKRWQDFARANQLGIAKIQAAIVPLSTVHHRLLIGSVAGTKLSVDIGQSIMGTNRLGTNLGLTFATAGLGFSVSQLLKGVETPGVASLVAQMNKPVSGWIWDEIADRMDEERKWLANINSLGKRQKLNRRDFNDLPVPGGKGRKKPGSDSGLDRYVLSNN